MPVEFNDEISNIQNAYTGNSSRNQSQGLIGLLMKTGITRDTRQANNILVALSVLFFLTSFYFFWSPSENDRKPEKSLDQITTELAQ